MRENPEKLVNNKIISETLHVHTDFGVRSSHAYLLRRVKSHKRLRKSGPLRRFWKVGTSSSAE